MESFHSWLLDSPFVQIPSQILHWACLQHPTQTLTLDISSVEPFLMPFHSLPSLDFAVKCLCAWRTFIYILSYSEMRTISFFQLFCLLSPTTSPFFYLCLFPKNLFQRPIGKVLFIWLKFYPCLWFIFEVDFVSCQYTLWSFPLCLFLTNAKI